MAKSSKKAASKSENLPVRRIGYARVSTADQNPDMQIAALEAYGGPLVNTQINEKTFHWRRYYVVEDEAEILEALFHAENRV